MKKVLALTLSLAMMLSFAACGKTETPTPDTEASGIYNPGTYEGTAAGFGGDLKVAVTLTAEKIEKVEVTAHTETEGIGTNAISTIPGKIVDAQSLAVDVVSGATVSSEAIIAAATAALTAAGVDVTALQQSTATTPTEVKDEVIEADIVIVGAGGAGLTAAIEAKTAGKNVVVIEKAGMIGGNSSRATGGMNAAATSVQTTLKIEDTVQQFIDDTMTGGKDINNLELVTAMAENSAGAIDWLASIGAPLPEVTTLGGATNPRAHRPEGGGAVGSYLVTKLDAKAKEMGITVMLETKGDEIIMKDGVAVGVKASSASTNYIINAKAVIIATGGFAANEEMYTKYRPELKGYVTTNAPGMNGDGIVMAEAVGASLTDIEQIQIHPTVEQKTSIMITEGLRGDGAILVNQSGKRFINEMETRDVVSAAEIAQEGSYAFLIFDQQLRDNVKAVEGYIKNDIVMQADTIEALAATMGVDAATLSATVATWNEAFSTKSDPEFGRTTGMDKVNVSVGPFYAIKIAPGVHHTMGGITINPKTEVISKDNAVIPGLYAAGEVTGGVHGANRLGGNAVADFVVFGLQAAKSAVEYVK